MKKSLLLCSVLTLGCISNVYANCLKDLCVNDTVMDSSDYVGVIRSVDEANNEFKVRREGYTYDTTSSYSELSKKIDSGVYSLSRFVIDESDKVGNIRHAFKDGRVQYRRIGYNYNHVSSRLAVEIDKDGLITKGKTIIDSSDKIGTVLHVFNDGRIEYRRQNYSYNHVEKKLAAKIELNTKLGIRDGSKVIDQDNKVGIVRNVFSDGRVEYRREGYTYSHVTKDLTVEVREYNNLAKDTTVIDSDDKIGIVYNVFRDGRVLYRRNKYNYNHVASDLVRKVNSTKTGIKMDDFVLDTDDKVGEVRNVFEDGRVEYRREGYNYSHIDTKLYKEVATNDKYEKGIEYASDDFGIGKINRFFENGKMQILTENSKRVVSVLYPEVESIGDLTQDSIVVVPTKIATKVLRLFANNTAEVTLEYTSSDEVVKENKLLKIIDIQSLTESDVANWLTPIVLTMEMNDTKAMNRFVTHLINEKDYKNLEISIVNMLDENNLSYNGKVKKYLLEYFDLSQTGSIVTTDTVTTDIENNVDTTVISDLTTNTVVDKITYQVVINKNKYNDEVISVFNKLNLNYILLSESELVDSSPVLRFNLKNKIFSKSCHISLQEGNSMKTDIYETNNKNILDICLEKLETLLGK